MTARVVIDIPCDNPRCRDGKLAHQSRESGVIMAEWTDGDCPTCRGTGTVQRVVTCAECRYFEKEPEAGYTHGRCRNPTCFGVIVGQAFGCSMWEARS